MTTRSTALPNNGVYSCTAQQFKELINLHKNDSLTKLKTTHLPRQAKRILRFIKYKTFGTIVSTTKSCYTVSYSKSSPPAYVVKPIPPKPVVVIQPQEPKKEMSSFEDYKTWSEKLITLLKVPRQNVTKIREKVMTDFMIIRKLLEIKAQPAIKTESRVLRAIMSEDEYVRCFWPGVSVTFMPPGLKGGGKKRKVRRQRRRPIRQGSRRPTTTNAMQTTSNLNIPRSVPPQYAPNVWSYISNVSSDAAGRFSFYVNIRNPAKAINGSGQYTRAVEDAKLWDGFFVRNYVLQIVPIIPTTVTAGAIIAAVDQEGVSPVVTPSYDGLIDRRYRSMFFGRQTKTINIRPKPLTSGTFEGRVCPIIKSGNKLFYDFEFPPDQGIIEVAAENFPPSSACCQIFLWMEVINFSPRTLPGTAPQRYSAKTDNGAPVPNPAPVIPLRSRARSC